MGGTFCARGWHRGGGRARRRAGAAVETLEGRLCLSAAPPFQAPSVYSDGVGNSEQAFLVADVTGDGKPDFIVGDVANQRILVVPNNGDGTFSSHVIASDVGVQPTVMAAGDFNGDGKPDLVTVSGAGGTPYSTAVLYGNGNGTFQNAVLVPGAGQNPLAIAVADFNGDGKPDYATLTSGPIGSGTATVTVMLNQGRGAFKPVTATVNANGTAMAVGDLNGDGKPDIVVTDNMSAVDAITPGNVVVLLSRGDGTFGPPVDYPALPDGPAQVALGDFNGDGKVDIATASALNAPVEDSAVLLGNGDGTFQPPVAYTSDVNGSALVAADFNGDGKTDLGVTNFFGDVSVLLATGGGAFGPYTHVAVNSTETQFLAAADLNGDGKPDLIAAGTSETPFFTAALNRGDGTFAAETNASLGTGSDVDLIASQQVDARGKTAPADLNGDGKADLVVATHPIAFNDTDPVQVVALLGNGDGTYGTPVKTPLPLPSPSDQVWKLMLADLNGDGKPDLIGVYSQNGADGDTGGGVFVMRGNGDGSFAPPVGPNLVADGGAADVAAGDFNGDGKLDLAVAMEQSSAVRVFLGNGDGTFRNGVDNPVLTPSGGALAPLAVVAADLNGDGRLDLVVGDQGIPTDGSNPDANGGVSVLLGNGNGTFQAARTYDHPDVSGLATVRVHRLVVADFNGDGKPDVLADALDLTTLGNGLALLTGNGDGTLRDPPAPVVPGFYGTPELAAADVNGDGKPDVLALSPLDDNVLAVALGNGNGTFQPPQYLPLAHKPPFALTDVNGDGKPDLLAADQTTLNDDIQRVRVILNAAVPPAVLQFASPSWGESREGGGSVTFQVNRTGSLAGPVTVDYATADGTARAGKDYVATHGTLTIPAGQPNATFSVPLINDQDDDGTETFRVVLGNPTGGAVLGPVSAATMTIPDAPGRLQFSGPTYSAAAAGGTALVTVTRTGGNGGAVTVHYATAGGTAGAGTDYTPTSGTLTLPDGVNSAVIPVPTLFDAGLTSAVTVNLTLTAPGGGAALGSVTSAVLTLNPADRNRANDFDTTGRSELAVFRAATSQWFVAGPAGGHLVATFGAPNLGDIPVSGDFDGVGHAEPAVFRPSTAQWYVLGPTGGHLLATFGATGLADIPVSGDYDGVGHAEPAVFRPATGQWFVLGPNGGHLVATFGALNLTDIPVPGDYDGVGHAEPAVFRPSTGQWFVLGPKGGHLLATFGATGLTDIPVPGDYDGVGHAEPAVFRPATGQWFVLGPTGGHPAPFAGGVFGAKGLGDIPLGGQAAALKVLGKVGNVHGMAVPAGPKPARRLARGAVPQRLPSGPAVTG